VPRYRFSDFVVSPQRRVLFCGGRERPLIPRYFDLLLFLLERRHQAVHRREIMDRVWSDVVVSDGALSQAVRSLRRAFGDDPREPRFVRTVSRHGYEFVFAAVTLEPDDGPLDVAPASRDLVGAEVELVSRPHRESVMRQALENVRAQYDYILIDCPPSLGMLTLNMLTAADAVIIPIQCEYYALEGLSQLLNTIRLVQRSFNPRLAIDGVLLTMYDARLNLSRQVADEAKEYFGGRMFRAVIPRNVRLAEAPSFGQSIFDYAPTSAGAQDYAGLVSEVIAAETGSTARRAAA